jgi:hypothetical protein
MNHRKLKFLALALVLLLALAPACSPKAITTGEPAGQAQTQSPEAIAFKTVSIAFDAYDLGMLSLRTLQRTKIITQVQYDAAKKGVAWPLYNAIVAAEKAAHAYATAKPADKEGLYGKLTQAIFAMAGSQKEFTSLVTSLQGGK